MDKSEDSRSAERISRVFVHILGTLLIVAAVGVLGLSLWDAFRHLEPARATMGILVCAGALALSLIWVIWLDLTKREDLSEIVRSGAFAAIPLMLAAGLAAFLGLAIYWKEIGALPAGLLWILGVLTIWFAWLFLTGVMDEGFPTIETHWGGLGGGMGGWRCSSSLMYLLCTLIFAGALSVLGSHQVFVSNQITLSRLNAPAKQSPPPESPGKQGLAPDPKATQNPPSPAAAQPQPPAVNPQKAEKIP